VGVFLRHGIYGTRILIGIIRSYQNAGSIALCVIRDFVYHFIRFDCVHAFIFIVMGNGG
jgi:hypothetical protein